MKHIFGNFSLLAVLQLLAKRINKKQINFLINENILLAAKVWKIKFIDEKLKRIEVVPALDGKKPGFFGGGTQLHTRVRQKMLELLYDSKEYDVLDESAKDQLTRMREDFSAFPVKDFQADRPLKVLEDEMEYYHFTGTKIARSINFLLQLSGIKSDLSYDGHELIIQAKKEAFLSVWKNLDGYLAGINKHIEERLQRSPGFLDFSKWGLFLPVKYQVALIKDRYFDFEEAREYLQRTKLVLS